MMRVVVRASLLSVALLGVSTPAAAQVVHAFNFGVGFFRPTPLDSRGPTDVLFANLNQPEVEPGVTGSLAFDFTRFRATPIFGEWQVAFSRHVEVGLGVSFTNRVAHSIYRDLQDSHGTVTTADDTDIPQDLRLRTIPITGVVRFVFGSPASAQGYVGGGVAAVIYRYTETGQFVDFSDFSIFNDQFVARGAAVGGVLLGGARFALGGDVWALTLEGRYQWAKGDTGGANAGFLAEKINLGGGTFNIGFLIRY